MKKIHTGARINFLSTKNKMEFFWTKIELLSQCDLKEFEKSQGR